MWVYQFCYQAYLLIITILITGHFNALCRIDCYITTTNVTSCQNQLVTYRYAFVLLKGFPKN